MGLDKMAHGSMNAEALGIRASIMRCRDCGLSSIASRPIPWAGDIPNTIAVLGEAPDEEADQTGVPLCGTKSAVFREVFDKVAGDDVARDFTYLNAVSCYGKRTPHISEVDACKSNRDRQLTLIAPRYLLVLGGVTLASFYPKSRMGDTRGQWWKETKWRGLDDDPPYTWCFATWGPDAVLRSGLESDIGRQFVSDVRKWWFYVSTNMKVEPKVRDA